MAPRIHLMAAAVLALSASAMANFLDRRQSVACPASRLMTTTVTVVSTATVTTNPTTTSINLPSTTVVVVGPTLMQETPSGPGQPSSVASTASNPGQSSVSPIRTPNKCSHNNCLRQFLRHPQVTAFCATYTTTVNTATADLPDFVSQCHANPTRISSACSCVVTGGVNPTSPTNPSTTPSGGVNPTSPINSSIPPSGSIVPTTEQSASGGGAFTSRTRTRHHHHHSQSTEAAPTTPTTTPTSSLTNSMCIASMITETVVETTTYLVTIIGSPSSNATSSGAPISAANTFISAISSSIA